MPFCVLIPAAVVASYTDLKWGKIKNWLTAPVFIAGIIYSLIIGGFSGAGQALVAGMVCPVFCVFLMYKFNGGDIKLFMACGAWLGLDLVGPFFAAMIVSRIVFGFGVRFKVVGWNPVKGLISIGKEIKEEINMFRGKGFKSPGTPGVHGACVVLLALVILWSLMYLPVFEGII